MARRLRMVAMALASALTVLPLGASAESLAQALASAYSNSGLLDQQRALLRAKDEDIAIAVAATRPVFTYALSFNSSWTDNHTAVAAITDTMSIAAQLNASLTLYDGGATQERIKLAEQNVAMAREVLRGVEQSVLLRAANAFLSMRSAHEKAMLQANNVRLITQELRAARDRFEVGEITQTDVSAAEAALAAAKAAEASARGALMVAREEYKAAIGHYPNSLEVPAAPTMPASSLDAAKAAARTRHPDVLSAQRAVSVAEIGMEIAKASMRPSITAQASIGRSYASTLVNPAPAVNTNRSTAQVGVTLSGPIYMGGKLSALYRQASANAEAARANLHVSVGNVEQNVGNAWAQLAIATASLQATDQQIRASRVALRGAREEAQLGARTTLEVLNFEQDLLDAQASRIEALAGQFEAVYALLASMGKLTASQLHLAVAAYDPEPYHNAVKDAPVRIVSPQGEKLDALYTSLGRTPTN